MVAGYYAYQIPDDRKQLPIHNQHSMSPPTLAQKPSELLKTRSKEAISVPVRIPPHKRRRIAVAMSQPPKNPFLCHLGHCEKHMKSPDTPLITSDTFIKPPMKITNADSTGSSKPRRYGSPQACRSKSFNTDPALNSQQPRLAQSIFKTPATLG